MPPESLLYGDFNKVFKGMVVVGVVVIPLGCVFDSD